MQSNNFFNRHKPEEAIDLNKFLEFSTFSFNRNKNFNNSNIISNNSCDINIENTINNLNTTYINNSLFLLENSKDLIDLSRNEIIINNNLNFLNKFNNKSIEENYLTQEKEKLRYGRIETIKNELEDSKQNCDFFKKNFNFLKFISRNRKKEKHLKNLIEIQNLQIDLEEIWICKFRQDGKYLATAGKSGTLKIWETLSLDDSLEEYIKSGICGFFKFFKDYPFRIYKEHISDIIDICWSNKVNNLISK